MSKIKLFTFTLIIFGSLFFLFGPEGFPEDIQFKEFLNSASQSDVIIIVNSGGWGNTPLEKAQDFTPIIEGIQEFLNEQGYDSIVIPYNRTKNTLLGKITGTKDFLNSFNFSSEIFAKDLEFLTESLPDKKIIIAGLSNGAIFVNNTYEKISDDVKDSVYAIEVGAPFWTDTFESDNILKLDNNGKDNLSKGRVQSLAFSLIKFPFKWVFSRINGQNLTLSQALHAPGHDYSWDSPEVSSKIVSFLETKLTPSSF